MKIKSNTTNNDLPWRFGLYQRPSSEEYKTSWGNDKETIHKKSANTVCQNKTSRLWLTMPVGTITWLTGHKL